MEKKEKKPRKSVVVSVRLSEQDAAFVRLYSSPARVFRMGLQDLRLDVLEQLVLPLSQ